MPLTQARYLSLLSACDAYEAWIEHIRNIVRTNDNALRNKSLTLSDAYNALANIIAEEALPLDAIRAVAGERAHFQATSRRNNLTREYRRRLRAGESTIGIVPQGGSAPRYTPPTARESIPQAEPIAASSHPQLTEEFLASVREGIAADLAGERHPLPSMRKCARWCGHKSGYSCLTPDSLRYRCVKDPAGELRDVEPTKPEAMDTESDF